MTSRSDMPVVMQIVGLVSGDECPFDGQFLVEYDPERDGTDPRGWPMMAHIVCTPHIRDARRFTDFGEAHRVWTRTCRRDPVRPDGKPNRPLTAFTVSIGSPGTF